MTAFLMIFRRFPTTFPRFPKIFQICFEGQRKVPVFFQKISEYFRRRLKIAEELPKNSKIAEDCQRILKPLACCTWFSNSSSLVVFQLNP